MKYTDSQTLCAFSAHREKHEMNLYVYENRRNHRGNDERPEGKKRGSAAVARMDATHDTYIAIYTHIIRYQFEWWDKLVIVVVSLGRFHSNVYIVSM